MTTILIAEDDEMLLSAMMKLFSMQGYAMRGAATGNEAIRILKSEPTIDVVISDYYMPDGDGRHLLNYIRNEHASRLVFILVTGQTDMRVQSAKDMGIDEFLTKPFSIRTLIAIVARRVSGASSPPHALS